MWFEQSSKYKIKQITYIGCHYKKQNKIKQKQKKTIQKTNIQTKKKKKMNVTSLTWG